VPQSLTVQMSRSRTIRVTFVGGVQDTCSSLFQRLHVQEFWHMLRGLHSWAEEKQKQLQDETEVSGSPWVATRAIARQGCEKLLGERLGQILDSRLLELILGRRRAAGQEEDSCTEVIFNSGGADDSGVRIDEASSVFVEELFERRQGQALLRQLDELGELTNLRGRGVRIVVKNSFIELVEEPSPREKRRARSCDAALLAAMDEEEDASSPMWITPPAAEPGLGFGGSSSTSFADTAAFALAGGE
ncbi:unnamed protein product, partial [Polarella glacialis]